MNSGIVGKYHYCNYQDMSLHVVPGLHACKQGRRKHFDIGAASVKDNAISHCWQKSISYLFWACFAIKYVQLNLVDPNTVYPNYSVFRSVLSGPVFYPSYFNIKITRWTELKHPNFSVFRIENLGLKFMFSTHEVIFESKCNLAPSWLAQTTLLHLKS